MCIGPTNVDNRYHNKVVGDSPEFFAAHLIVMGLLTLLLVWLITPLCLLFILSTTRGVSI